MQRRRALIRSDSVYAIAFPPPYTPAQRNAQFDFNDPAAYFVSTGMTVSGSKMNLANVAQFTAFSHAYGFRVPIVPSIPYTVKIGIDSFVAGPKDLRFVVDYWRGQVFADGQSTIKATEQLPVFAGNVGVSPAYSFIPPADCTHLEVRLQTVGLDTTATFDNFTVTG